MEQGRIRLERELLTRCVAVCNRASVHMKQHSHHHGCASLTLEFYAAELSSLLLEIGRVLRFVDEEWVVVQRDEKFKNPPALPNGTDVGQERYPDAKESISGNTHFLENIGAAEDSQQVITVMPGDRVLACNVTAGARSIQHIGSQLPASSWQ